MSESYSIAELAREFGVTTRTIRFYEAEGMIDPRRDGRRRIYGPRQRTRLKLILRGKRLGLSLKEIREIIDLYGAAEGEVGQLSVLIERIAERRGELEAKRRDLDAALADLAEVEANCRRRLGELTGAPAAGETAR
jgi:DNA-binding transcriptional MerR regulator